LILKTRLRVPRMRIVERHANRRVDAFDRPCG
jgi:hypothetical protein